jgi:uncharacterized protein YukE
MAPPSSSANNRAIKHDFGMGDTGDAVHGKWYQVWDNAIDEMNQILDALQPEKVDAAGRKYSAVATRMNTTISDLYKHAQTLSEHWGGDDADKAMTQMQKMYTEAQQIQSTSDDTGWTLSGHAATLRNFKNPANRPQGASGLETGVAVVTGGLLGGGADRSYHNAQARNYMSALQKDTQEANGGFPAHIRSDQAYATLDDYNPNPGGPGGPGSHLPGGGGGGAGHIPGAGSGGDIPGTGTGGHIPGTGTGGHISGTGTGGHIPSGDNGYIPGTGTGGHIPGSGGGSGTDLAGFDPSGGSGLGGGGLGGGGLGGDPLGAGAGSGLTGVGPGGLGSAGLGRGLGSGAGAGAGRAGMAGRGMMPMAPGGHGQGEKERERSTWLTEDEDVWGGDGDAAPPLIG